MLIAYALLAVFVSPDSGMLGTQHPRALLTPGC